MNTATKYKTYPKYKSSGIDGSTSLTTSWLGEIPEEWKTKRLRFVLNTVGGNGFPEELQGKYEGDYPFYKVSDINGDGLYLESSNNYVDRADILKNKWKIVPKDSIVTAKIGAALSLNHRKITKLDALIDNNMLGLSIKSKEYNLLYVYYLFKLIDLDWFVNPGAVPSVNIGQFIDTLLPLPSFPEQQSIADFLDRETVKIDEMVEKKQKLMELLKEKRQALITHAVTKGLDPSAKLKPSGIDWLGDIPEGWEVKKAKYLGRAIIGLTYSPDEVVNENEGVLILRSSNIQNGLIELNDNVYVKKEIPEDLITKIGDILICSRNGSVQLIGKNILIDESTANLSFGAFMTIFRSKYHEFLYYFFNSSLFTSQTGLFSTSTINQLTTSILDNMEIPLPSGEVQKEIVIVLKNKTAKIDEMMKKVETQIEKLKEYRQTLITSAVTGKIMVN